MKTPLKTLIRIGLVALTFIFNKSFPQISDSLKSNLGKETKLNLNTSQSIQNKNLQKPEILTSGFIDIVNNGQVNASARFIRLLIGEPGKLVIPLSIYSGVSSNNFQSGNYQRNNDILVTNFINPLSGITNLSIDGILFRKKDTIRVTRFGLLYHIGERVLTGIRTGPASDPSTGKPINFLNSFGSLGVYFQTGAWDRNNSKNMGVTWLVVRYIGCYTNSNQLREFIPTIKNQWPISRVLNRLGCRNQQFCKY